MNHAMQSPGMQECIDACLACHQSCLQMAMNHCLQAGGQHTEPEHFKLMINCAEICQTSANFMLSGSAHHAVICNACAQICEACADSCEQIGDMDACVQACRRCADSCNQMAQMQPQAMGRTQSASRGPRASI